MNERRINKVEKGLNFLVDRLETLNKEKRQGQMSHRREKEVLTLLLADFEDVKRDLVAALDAVSDFS